MHASLVVLLAVVAVALGSCVAPPSDLRLCRLPVDARVPQEFANTQRDRALQATFDFLDAQHAMPTKECAEAYLEFECSKAYPRCTGDALSGLSGQTNTCYFECDNFVRRCRGQLIGVERPNCGTFSVDADCTARQLKISSSRGAASTLSAGSLASVLVVIASLFVLLF
eukprot:TRINITY_DN94_c5_g1_i1.p1 TRINITY_DN94_c5_g1~~TRINITY_DN94_c5_g1_i1.p1  ORF type:complete len:186 (+),score=67.95 TRINITY_DN94_c5_g1_i1:53-559(+)